MLCCRSFGSPVSWPLFCSLRQWAAVLSAAAVSAIAAVLYLAFADAYDFYSAGVAKKAVRHTGRTGNVFTYLLRYLMANKTYLINTAGLAAVAGFYRCCLVKFKA